MCESHINWIRQGLAATALIFCNCLSGISSAADPELKRFEFLQIRMGIPVKIVVYADEQTSAIQASDAAYDRIRQIDRALSDYDPDSEASQLCQKSEVGSPVPVGEDFLKVFAASRQLWIDSDGAFDVTVSPVVKLWRVARRKKELPAPAVLQAALDRVGSQYIDLDPEHKTITLKRPGIQLDFGGIAKGYAADEAYEVLKKHGCNIALIAVAGDLRLGDPPPGTSGWTVQVEDHTVPPTGQVRPAETYLLANQAISTAGDAYQFVEVGGVRYSHIVDPKTGMGMTSLRSVTVIAPTGMQADGLDSTMVVLGPEAGMKLIEGRANTFARYAQVDAHGVRTVITSPGWPKPLTD